MSLNIHTIICIHVNNNLFIVKYNKACTILYVNENNNFSSRALYN